MLAPQSVPGFDPSESNEDVREQVRATLAKIRTKASTGRLNGDSKLFRLKQKLTELGCPGDADRRRRYLDEDEQADVEAVADQG